MNPADNSEDIDPFLAGLAAFDAVILPPHLTLAEPSINEGYAYIGIWQVGRAAGPPRQRLARFLRRLSRGRRNAVEVEFVAGQEPTVRAGRQTDRNDAHRPVAATADVAAALDLSDDEAAGVLADVTAAARQAVHAHDVAHAIAAERAASCDTEGGHR